MAISQNRAAARAERRDVRVKSRRVSNETLLTYAGFLPDLPRAIVTAHLDLGMAANELALLHGVTLRQMRRRLDRLRETLADPCFLLTAQYGDQLPEDLRGLAKGYWIEGRTLRELAASHGRTLHQIRKEMVLVRSLLLVSLSSRHAVTSEQAFAVLDPASSMR